MLHALLALIMAQQEVPPPRGVNSAILGTAEEFRVQGPARVCFPQTSVDLLRGENAYLDYMGIHYASVRVIGPRGTFFVRDGDAWRAPDEPGNRVRSALHRRIIRHTGSEGLRYLIFGRPDHSPNEDRAMVWVEGEALTGDHRDRRILNRVLVHRDRPAGCRRTFIYGMFFEDS